MSYHSPIRGLRGTARWGGVVERALAYHIRASLEIYLAAHVTQGQRVVVVASHHLRAGAREQGRIKVLCASVCKFCIMIYTPRYTGNPSVSCLCRSLCLCLCLSPRSHGNSQKPAATGFDGRTDRRRQPLVTATDPSFRIWSGHRAINFYNLLQRYATTFYRLYNLLSHV